MGGAVGIGATPFQGGREGAEPSGGVPGDLVGGGAGTEGGGIGEDLAEDVEVDRIGEAVQVETVGDGGGAGEVGADLEAIQVADDEEGRVLQVVLVELAVVDRKCRSCCAGQTATKNVQATLQTRMTRPWRSIESYRTGKAQAASSMAVADSRSNGVIIRGGMCTQLGVHLPAVD
ncbi:MAG: hypothetical protein M3Q71_16430 [Chloroflexota bacterium]|nr:hypothetical protein [Chloroflexota bacterium]